MKPGDVRWAHSSDPSPEEWSASFETREACIEDGKKEHEGRSFWIASGTAPKPSQFANVDRMIEDMGESACDEFGAEDFPDMSHDRKRSLIRLIEELLDAHVDMTFVVMNDDAEEISP